MGVARRIGKWLAVALAGVLALLLVVFAAIQTPPGKAMLASLASSLASSEGMRVEISGIGGFIPSDMSVENVRISDPDGPFAEVADIRLAWSPLALVTGTLDITDAGAARVALMRKPELPPAPEATPEAPQSSSGGFMLPVRIGRFALDEIDIAEPVLGHEAVLSLNASAELLALDRGLSADFDLQRRDSPGSVKGTLHYAPETSRLDGDVTAEEPAGGLVARAAGMDGLPALLIAMPILMPIAISYGVDPIHFGILVEANVALGLATPPVGMCLYAACAVSSLPLEKVARPLLPFIAVLVVTMLIITYVEGFSMFLPRLLGLDK
jgi:translocation and assembly module TamB